MIQDIFPYRYDVHYENKTPEDMDFLVASDGKFVMLKKPCDASGSHHGAGEDAAGKDMERRIDNVSEEDDMERFPKVKDVPEKFRAGMRYLFAIGTHNFFLLPLWDHLNETAATSLDFKDYEKVPAREMRYLSPEWVRFATPVARQMANWYKESRYCGVCGSVMEHSKTERAMVCPKCGKTWYPHIAPAVIVGVRNGDRLLLTKYADRDYTKFALIAGFTETGEPIEDTVRREVKEEAGIDVKNIRYYGSQPWPFPDTLLLGFWCDLDGTEEIHMDDGELSVAAFMTAAEMRENGIKDDGVSLTREMMRKFMEEHQ